MVGFWVQTLCRIIDDPTVTEEYAAPVFRWQTYPSGQWNV